MKEALIVILIAALIVDPISDYYLIEANKAIRHARGAVLFGVGAILPMAGYVLLGGKYGMDNNLPFVLQVAALLPGFRWVIHDGLLNHLRGLPFSYYGTSENAAQTDKMLEWLDLELSIHPTVAKISALFISYLGAKLVPHVLTIFIS